MITTATNQTATAELTEGFDVEEMAMLKATLSKIKNHVDKHIEASSDPGRISKYLSFRWYLNKNF